MPETPQGDSEREVRDHQTLQLWERMQVAACETEWSRLREELYLTYEVLSFSFGARYFGNKRLSPDDIRQCCRIGVVQAIDEWDPTRGSLTTMVAFKVSVELRTWCRAEGVFPRSSSHDQDDDSQQTCQPQSRRKCDLTYVSFEDFASGDSTLDFVDAAVEQGVPSHEENSIIEITLDTALQALTPDKREIVEKYYGLKGNEEHTMRDLAPLFDVSYETIRNRLSAAHRQMAPLLEGF